MNSSKPNICIVGCGGIAKAHSRNLSPHANLHFFNPTISKAESFNRQYNGSGVFDSFDQILKTDTIDALLIASPPRFHKQQAIDGIKAGKHMLVEKPLCINREELQDIERAVADAKSTAERKGPLSDRQTVFMVAENYYYKPSLTKIKEIIGSGVIGDIVSVHARKEFTQPQNESGKPGSDWKKNYGALFEGGIHFIALISAIIEDTPEHVEVDFPGMKPGTPERASVVTMKYKNGVHATLKYAWNKKSLTKGLFQHSIIKGTKANLIFESNGLYIIAPGIKKLTFPGLSDVTGQKAMAMDFLSCIREQKQPLSDFAKAKRDLEIVFKAYDTM